MTSPIRDIDAARRALVAKRRAFQIAIGAAFWWVHTPQGDEFWSGEYEAGRLSSEGRAALEAMIAEYEAEDREEVVVPAEEAAPAPDATFPVVAPPADDPVKAEMLAALKGVLRVADRDTTEFDAVRAAIKRAEGRS